MRTRCAPSKVSACDGRAANSMSQAENVYELLDDDSDGRLCEDIPEQACQESPRNFALMLTSLSLTKLGDAITNPKTTLAWLVSALGAPGYVLGYLVPLRESGAMVPQLFLGGVIRRLPLRKWVWVLGSLGQGLAMAGLAVVALTLEGVPAGWAMLSLVALFSLCRSLSSIAYKDVLGKTIPKTRRGQLAGWASSVAGLIGVAVGSLVAVVPGAGLEVAVLAALLLTGALLWWVSAAVFAQLDEQPGETGGGRSALDSIRRLSLLRDDPAFRNFVIARALLMCSALSSPFYVALAQQGEASSLAALGGFVIASGIAGLVSGPFWGRYADRSSRLVMFAAALVTSGIGLLTFAVAEVQRSWLGNWWFLPLAYLVLAIAHEGVRVGRSTYVVNLGDGNMRTDYVAISNTVIGVLLLLVGSVGLLVPWLGNAGVIAVLALMGLVGAVMTFRLADV